jgi:exopolyphosphatase/guanosine-5'-triphosphate,3'-diphosphate pyrophosphatase
MPEDPPRAAVLDVGCFSAHLLVVEHNPVSLLRPIVSHKVRLRLDRSIDEAGRITASGIDRITEAVQEVQERLQRVTVSTFLPFATSSVRDAANADQVITKVAKGTGMELQVFTGRREAHLSYLAARHWFGPRPLTVLDVGGGTVELAVGDRRGPTYTCSLPLGARTLTRAGMTGDLTEIRAELVDRITDAIPDDRLAELARGHAVGCSKVFEQMARLTGARKGTRHQLRAADLELWIPKLAALPARRRAALPGISRHRARQSFAGAVVAEALMKATGHDVIDICPWSTKEGLLINLLTKSR